MLAVRRSSRLERSAGDEGGLSRIAALGRRLCLGGAAIGALGVLGSVTGTRWLTTLAPGQPTMVPNSSVALLLIGVAGALRAPKDARGWRRALSLLAAGVVLVIGAVTLVEYALEPTWSIDRLITVHVVEPHPGRPSPPTALALACLGAALLLLDARPAARARPSEWLALSAGLVAFTAALGQLLGAGTLYSLDDDVVIGVAVPTALSLLLTSLGLLLERPDAGVMRVVVSPGPGGVLMRRLTLAAVLGPVLLGAVLMRVLAELGVVEFALVYATLMTTATVVGLILLYLTAEPLDRVHARLEASRARTQALFDQASDGIFVTDRAGRYTEVNDAGCRMLGYSKAEIVGRTMADLIPREHIERLAHHRARLRAGDTQIGEWTLRRRDGSELAVEVSAKILPDGRGQTFVRDISERRRAQEERRCAMERFELALRGADLGAWDWNVTTGEIAVNPRWAELRGLRLEDIRLHVDTWRSGIHPDDLPGVERVLAAYLDGLLPEYESEHRVATATGGWVWILDRGRIFARDAQGRPTRMVGTELDITARRRAAEALRLSEAKYSGIVAISGDAIISVDGDQRITLFNAGAEKVFGYAQSELLGAPLGTLIPEKLQEVVHRHVARAMADGELAPHTGGRALTLDGLRKNGEQFPAEASLSRLDVGGTRLLTVSLRDVTEQRRVEREKDFLAEVGAVLASSLDYQDTMTSIAELAVRGFADTCVIVVVEASGEPRLKAVSRDPSRAWACELLMRLPLDRERQHLTSSAQEAGRAVLQSQLSPASLVSLAQSEEQLRALRALDPRSLIEVPLIAHARRLGGIAFVSSSLRYGREDIHLAEEIAQRAALALDNARLYCTTQRAVQARDDVLGIVAHDLRNPVGVIHMQAALLRRHPERAAQSADVIERSARRMNRLIQDLLDVTCVEAGQLSVERGPVPIGKLLADAVEVQRTLACSAALELHLDVAPGLPDLSADRDRLLQVFENLIGNALKFTAAGGRITIGAAARGGEVQFQVADTGAGIPAEDVPHLFDRFWRSRRAARRGAGLGLSIAKGVVEAHGGRIWVESTPGRGTTVCFTIPGPPSL